MKLLTFIVDGQYRLGVKQPNGVIDVAAVLAAVPATTPVPTSVQEVIEGGAETLAVLRAYIDGLGAGDAKWLLDESSLTFGPAVPQAKKIICIGLNYRKHAEETNSPIPKYPVVFNKFHNALAAHGDSIPLPRQSQKVDYEAELAIVIGRKAKYVAKEEALDYVFGYCNVNDLSARDWQQLTSQWLLGKSCDKFAPLGPYVVTADEVGNPNQLEIRLTLNGEVRQHSNTSDMIFHCDEIISCLSRHMTLYPGDVILTGTPEGVIMGYPPERQVYLKDGDVVTVEIEKLGALTNRMVAE
jgi:2-keto-4-pentenoate hydratase/2-oxohepta-3-ene-1,7-dioic acid hydratase in catechol pathway